MNNKRRKKLIVTISIMLLAICIFLIILLLKSCNQKEENISNTSDNETSTENISDTIYNEGNKPIMTPLEPIEGVEAEIINVDSFDRSKYEIQPINEQDCSFSAKLLIADGPGIPTIVNLMSDSKSFINILDKSDDIDIIQLSSKSMMLPIKPPPPLSEISVLNPKAGISLLAGSKYLLKWSVQSNKTFIYDISFSSDGGKTFDQLVNKIGDLNTLSYTITVPNIFSDTCMFRVTAWDGTSFFGYNNSSIFKVVDKLILPTPNTVIIPINPTETPTIKPTPMPTIESTVEPTRKLPSYVEDDNVFINESKDTSRYFHIEHNNSSVKSMTWQVSQYPFDCEPGTVLEPISGGLLAYGELTGDTTDFVLDFKAILSNYKIIGEEKADDEYINKGIKFNTVPDLNLFKQKQYDLYTRVTLYDDLKQVVGITKSDFRITYGSQHIQVDINDDEFTSQYTQPIIKAVTEVDAENGDQYEVIPDSGLYILSGKSLLVKYILDGVLSDSVELDLQIASVPFKNVTETDYQQPSGLVYQEEFTDLVYNLKTQYFKIPMGDFMPTAAELGEDTVWYFIRAICYVPNEEDGTIVPIATKTYKIVYTGDMGIYLLGTFDPSELPPEEIEVESYVPETDFIRYEPARWAIENAEEYFEVTRPIQAEEICFYIKNNNTGDFLYPYITHMTKYPGTTREEYQATVDRMLPVGAWFRLTVSQSGWNAFWDEFSDLATQWYNQIREGYNGSQDDIANSVADQFESLGPDVQDVIRKGCHLAINYCLAYVGLPPELPNMEELTKQGIDYVVYIALEEAAEAYGVPIDEIPPEVREAIIEKITEEIVEIESMKHVNPLGVDYLKPATQAMYEPGYVELNIRNTHDKYSPNGSLTISYNPKGSPHYPMYMSKNIYIPSIPANDSLRFKVYLKHGRYGESYYEEYFNGLNGDCILVVYGDYNIPDVDTMAAEQGVTGESDLYPDSFYFDVDPKYHYKRINVPSEGFYD